MADPQHKVVKLPSGEVIAFPGSMPDAHVAGLITAFRQGKFNSPEYGQVHTGNLHAQVSPKTTDNSEHLRQSGDTTPQLPAPSWNELRQYVNDKTHPTVLPPLQGKLNASQSAQDINARANNFTQNSMKRAARFLFGVVDMVPQTASTLVNLFSSDPKVSQQAESDLLSMHPGAQISDRGKEFLQDWKQSPALAGSNLTGDALGFYLAGRMGPHDISAVPVKDIPSRFRTRKIYSGPLGDVRIGTDRIPTIWMHPKAWDSLMGVLYPGENPGESHGMSLGADHNLLKLAQDRGLSQTPEFKEVQTMLEKAHREAQGQADSVAIGVKRGKGIQYAVRAMREERNHAWQRSLSQNKSIYTHLSPQGFDDVKKSIPGSMSAHLEFEGYDANSAPEMVSESAARFIGGELRGSTPEEAGEFLDRYFQQAVKEHGPKALETLEHVRGEGAKAKERINAEHNASEQGATRTGVPEVATGRQGGAGATPEGGTGQTGTTAPEVALNRNKGDKRDFPLLGVSMARTAEGKVKLGADAAALGKILGSSLYKSDAPKVITKELIQNAMDAVRESTGDKNVTVEIFNGTYPPLPRGKVVPHPDAANFPDHFAIQNPDGSYVHTTWIDSPNEIRPWKYDYDAEYALNALSPHRDNGAKAIRITDTGIGMTKHQLETVFTDLGASGKRDMEEASGGFGLAKAAPLMMSQQLDVSTVVNEGGKLMRHSFSATPEDLLGSGVDIKSEELPAGSVSTGTTITSILPKEADMYGARGFIGQSNISLRPPGHVKFFVDQKEMEPPIRDDVQTTPIATRDVPGAKLDLYTSYKKNDNPMGRYGGMAVEIHNNGVYQLTQHVDVPEGVRGLPARAAIDVRATVPEGHNDYPFTANREELRGMLDDAIRSFIKEKIVKPVAEAHSRQLSEMYYSFPMINDFMPVFDSGKRLTPEEFTELTTNPAIKEISESIFMLTGEARAALEKAGESNYRMEGFGQKTKRVGIILSEDVHGVHITNPDDRSHATIFINPFDDPYEHGPDEIASLIWHTIKHELGHDKVAGHTEEFTTAEKNISRALGKMEIKALNELRSKYANPDEPDTIRPEFDRAFQIYKDSRRREETAPDIFRGEESNTGVAKTGGAQAGDGGVRDRGEGSFSDKLQSLKKEVEARKPDIALARSKTNTPAFKEWFGESKAKDEKGEPLVLYHGTTRLKPRRLRTSFESGIGIFLTNNQDVADTFTYPREYGEPVYEDENGKEIKPGSTVPVYARIENPLVLTGDTAQTVSDDTAVQSRTLRSAKEAGHDGVILRGVKEGIGQRSVGDTYIVFDPKQVKGVKNSGAFSRDTADLALNRERPESGEAYEKLSRLRINADLGQENTAALVTPKGKVLVGDWHTELYKESGYGDKGGEAKFFKEGGVRIRAQNNESHIEFSQIDPATVERVTNAIHALPGREVTLEYMPLGLGKGTLFSLGDKTRALSDLSMWARRGDRSAPQYGSAAYWHQQGDAAFNRQNPWYLKSERLISEKMHGPMPADDLQKMLQAGGIKEDEMKWTGLDEFLKSKGKEKVTPDQVRDYITKNSLQVKEVMRRTGGLKPTMAQEDAIVLWAAQHDTDRRANSTWYKDDAGSTIPTVKQAFHDIRQGRLEEGVGNLEMLGVPDDLLEPFRNYAGGEENVPRFGGTNLVLPGGQNYKELLFELPKSKPVLATESADREYREWVASVAAHHGWDTSQWPAEFQAEKEQRLNQFTLARHEEIHASHANTFRTTHWPSNENVVGHLRFNDRTGPNGEKLLHVEEVQSDWHQKGRKQGYANPLPQNIPLVAERKGPSWFEVRTDAGEFVTNVTLEHAANEQTAIAEARRRMREDPTHTYQHRDGRVPDAPWKKTWHEMLLRRMVQYAAQNGYDGVTWTPGAAQAERYDLSQHIDSLRYSPYGNGTFEVDAVKDGHIVQSKIGTPQQLEEFVGKDVVQKITNGEGRDWYTALGTTPSGKELVGVNLKVGGEGMHGFYDKIVPEYLNKFGKKWGARVGETEIPFGGGGPEHGKSEMIMAFAKGKFGKTVPYLPITSEMRDSLVREGVPMFNREKDLKLDNRRRELPEWDGEGPIRNFVGREPGGKISKIQMVPIDSVAPTEDSNPETVDRITHALLYDDGEPIPAIVVERDNEDGKYFIVDGHNRLAAAKKAGYKQVPIRIYTHPEDIEMNREHAPVTPKADLREQVPAGSEGPKAPGSTKTVWNMATIGALKGEVLQNSPHKVEAPDGKTYVFPDLDSLNNFRNEANIK